MQTHEQIRAALVRQRGTVGQFDIRVLRSRQDDIEAGLSELVAQLRRQRQRIDLFVMPAHPVAGVLAAVARDRGRWF